LVSAMAALLMVSRIPMLSFKISSVRETANFYRAAIMAVTLTALIFWGMAAIPVSVVLYLFFSILALPHLNGSRPVSS